MKYFVYYDKDNNGAILNISPTQLEGKHAYEFIKIDKEEALLFIQGKERPAKWRVDCIERPKLIKKDNHVFHQYDSHGFFNIKSQQSTKPVIIITIKGKEISITTNNTKNNLMFFLTIKDNPTFIIENLTINAGISKKTFISPINNFSIFANHNFGNIKWTHKHI